MLNSYNVTSLLGLIPCLGEHIPLSPGFKVKDQRTILVDVAVI